MRVLRRTFQHESRSDTFRIYPIADSHIGAANCDEKRLKRVVAEIANDPTAHWIGLGDYCDFVLKADKRYHAGDLAKWVKTEHTVDLARHERDRFLDIIKPICTPGKCLALVEGNHEFSIKERFERDVFSEIVTTVKEWSGMAPADPLGVGVCGWLVLRFDRMSGGKRAGSAAITISLHHGFTGGRLAGAKALNMQRWLWNHDCDLALMGHSHIVELQIEAVERVRGNSIVRDRRIGCFCGAFVDGAGGAESYAERRGYFPTGQGQVVVVLRPGAKERDQRISVLTQ